MFYCELLSGLWIGDTDILTNEKFIQDNNITINAINEPTVPGIFFI